MKRKALHKIIKRAIAGDQEALGMLCELNGTSILFHVRTLIRNPANADEAAQEVFVRMIEGIGKIKSPYAFSSWLQTLTVHTCIDFNRKVHSRGLHEQDGDTTEELLDEDIEVMPEQAFDKNFDQTNTRDVMYGYIKRLPEAQRTTLVMRYYDEMSYKEIARALGVEVGTISTHLHLAKKNLATMMRADGVDVRGTGVGVGVGAGALVTGSFITETLRYEVANVVSSVDLANYVSRCTCTMTTQNVNAASAQSQFAAGKLSGKFLAATISGIMVVVVGAGVLAAVLNQPETPAIMQADTIRIEFSGNPSADNVNPAEVWLVVEDKAGEAEGWYIADAEGRQLATGAGDRVDRASLALQPGEYTITWHVDNKQGTSAFASRVFYIS